MSDQRAPQERQGMLDLQDGARADHLHRSSGGQNRLPRLQALRRYAVLAAIATAALCFVGTASADGWISFPISDKASEFAGKQIDVQCEDLPPGMFGFTYLGDNWLALNKNFCNPLDALAGGVAVAPVRQAEGLSTLAHEVQHDLGVKSEPRAECYAYQRFDDLASVFGVDLTSPYYATLWALNVKFERWFTRIAPWYWNRHKCHENGAWDLTPHDGVWP